MTPNFHARREFLRFLAASPLLTQAWGQDASGVIASAKDAINVMDFEPLARKVLPPAHWGYMATGVDDDVTLRMNRQAFEHYQLRARRLVDVSQADLKTQVFGTTWDMPIYVSAVGSQKAFNRDGEVATARAAKAKRAMQMLSTASSTPVEEVSKALGTPPWFQLYMPLTWDETEKLVKRVEAAGCPVLAWTIDLLAGRNTETATRFTRLDNRDCLSCHMHSPKAGANPADNAGKPMLAGLAGTINPPQATWAYVDRLKKMTKMKLVLKGIDTGEDAKLAREHGADGVIVSNHGGRATETGRGTIDVLPEVIDAVGPQFPVFVDGGFRRGSDVYKALAIGAKGVGIGRAYIYGLSSFGQEGVERVLDILRAELTLTMRQCGTPTVASITRASVLKNGSRL
ncbi:MAG: alpha-hydroxy-acid oxidizing protein [Bryobacterales bacterium]|nr:alpha-hydroxy-acid oxidizing protein [Bryobacterales bacterium]